MRKPLATLTLVTLLGLGLSSPALAHWRGRGHFDIILGPPIGWSYYPPPPPRYYYDYYPPPVVMTPPPQQVYIEQAPKQAAPPQSYWYYCTNPQGYYPTVKECPGGWLKVVPQPTAP